jgi:CRP/FNR family cyclic AMP-dependent transcriptional regulator
MAAPLRAFAKQFRRCIEVETSWPLPEEAIANRHMQILAELANRFLAGCELLPSVEARRLLDGAVIYNLQPVGEINVVSSGYVRLVYTLPDGKQLTKMILGKGAMFGTVPFQPDLGTDETAIAIGPARVLRVDRSEVEQYSMSDPEFQGVLLQVLSSQFHALARRMHWQLVTPLRSRVALALADLTCFAGERCHHGHLIDVRLTHEEISALVVAARPAVSKILGEFKSLGMLSYHRSHLCLRNLQQLLEIAGTTC